MNIKIIYFALQGQLLSKLGRDSPLMRCLQGRVCPIALRGPLSLSPVLMFGRLWGSPNGCLGGVGLGEEVLALSV